MIFERMIFMRKKMAKMYETLRKMNNRMGNISIVPTYNSEGTFVIKKEMVFLDPIRTFEDLAICYASDYSMWNETRVFNRRLGANVKCLSDEHKQFLKSNIGNSNFWWFNDMSFNKNSPFRVIRERLLEFGGEAVCIPHKEDSFTIHDELLLEFGQLLFCNKNYITPICDCVKNPNDDEEIENLRQHYVDNVMGREIFKCFGYRLNNDGIWRETWFFYNQETDEIIDLTSERFTTCIYGCVVDRLKKRI